MAILSHVYFFSFQNKCGHEKSSALAAYILEIMCTFTNGFFFKKATPYKSFFLNKNKVSPIADVNKQVSLKITNGAADLNK